MIMYYKNNYICIIFLKKVCGTNDVKELRLISQDPSSLPLRNGTYHIFTTLHPQSISVHNFNQISALSKWLLPSTVNFVTTISLQKITPSIIAYASPWKLWVVLKFLLALRVPITWPVQSLRIASTPTNPSATLIAGS